MRISIIQKIDEDLVASYLERILWLTRSFIINYNAYRRDYLQRETKRRFLKPLLIPQWPYNSLTIDSVTLLAVTQKNIVYYLCVIVNRLTKAVILKRIVGIKAEAYAQRFLKYYYSSHTILIFILAIKNVSKLIGSSKGFISSQGLSNILTKRYKLTYVIISRLLRIIKINSY